MPLSRKKLIAAQLEFWPDSRIVTHREALQWIDTPLDIEALRADWLERYNPIFLKNEEMLKLLTLEKYIIERTLTHQHMIARAVASALAQGPVVFYECHKRDNTYAYRGARYGLDGSQYISGYFGKEL